MNNYEVHPLILGKFQNYEKSWLVFNNSCGQKMEALVLAFLIQGNNRNILVDTGCSNTKITNKKSHPYLVRDEKINIVDELSKWGVMIEEIDCIIQTHLHWDCCYGNEMFPNTKIYVQRKEVEYAINPLPCHYEEYETGHAGGEYPWVKSFSRFEFVDGDKEIYPGIMLLALPGHSPGFQGVLVDTDKGRCMIAGDTLPLRENLYGIKNKESIPSAIHVNTSQWFNSVNRIKEKSDLILYGRELANQ